jgi:hypothetical protein
MPREKKKIGLSLLLLSIIFLTGSRGVHASEYILVAHNDIPSIIVCSFSKGIYVDSDNEKLDATIVDEKSFEIIISEPFGDRPVMKGNRGESKLLRLGAGQGVVYLLELTEAGNVNYITLFPHNKMVVFVKQYMLPSGVPIAMTLVGRYR